MTDEQKLKDILEVLKSLECKSSDDRIMGVLYDEAKGSIIFEYQSGQEIKVKAPEFRETTKFERIRAFIKRLFKQ